ncbi:Calx-beta domain-containing protein, partial [Sphingomonas sp.]|uniref:Calx-beta domain-containing protein n=1 Tax=Sphingomonas sp. TaxID=28214 RepID=UPI003D6CE7E5
AGSDYTATSGTLTFAPGETSKTISVATIDDTSVESAETVLVNLSAASGGATITTAQGSGTINDNDVAPPPSFAISGAASVTEGGTLVYTVTKTGSTAASFTVNFATANGTAIAGSDYTATSGTLTFAPGETSKTISVATIDDTSVESAETVLVNLSAASGGATITTAQGSGTINDNDVAPPPSFAISGAAPVTEGGTLVYTVTKTGSTAASFTVNFATADGTAVAGSDYTAASGTLTFASGDTSKTINVVTIDDTSVESAETVLVNLSAASGGAPITATQGSGTINDNDAVNQPPVANADTGSVPRCGSDFFNVVANDTDPEGDYPLTVVSITGSPTFTVASSTSVQYRNSTTAGTKIGTYVVRDARGAQSTGTITITVPSGVCE